MDGAARCDVSETAGATGFVEDRGTIGQSSAVRGSRVEFPAYATGSRIAGNTCRCTGKAGRGLCAFAGIFRTAFRGRANRKSTAGAGRKAAGQLSLFSSDVCRTNAEAAAPGGTAGVFPGDVHQSEQSRAGWRTRDLEVGNGSGHGNRGDVRMEEISRTFVRRRDYGQPGSAVGDWAVASRKEDCGERPGALHT